MTILNYLIVLKEHTKIWRILLNSNNENANGNIKQNLKFLKHENTISGNREQDYYFYCNYSVYILQFIFIFMPPSMDIFFKIKTQYINSINIQRSKEQI